MNSSYYVSVAIAPVRQEPSDKAEQVTQFLFHESIELLEKHEKWSLVRSRLDGYEGWIDNKQYHSGHTAGDQNLMVLTRSSCLSSPSNELWVPHGTALTVNKEGYTFGGYRVCDSDLGTAWEPQGDNLIQAAKLYLNTPYLWGGRSIWGIDCSGFVQQVFRVCGVPLPRDASQQASRGENIDLIAATRAGDLAFFDNDEGKITHVGILIDSQHIIHASGQVRIDRVDHLGIFHEERGAYTHKLRLIKRMF